MRPFNRWSKPRKRRLYHSITKPEQKEKKYTTFAHRHSPYLSPSPGKRKTRVSKSWQDTCGHRLTRASWFFRVQRVSKHSNFLRIKDLVLFGLQLSGSLMGSSLCNRKKVNSCLYTVFKRWNELIKVNYIKYGSDNRH